MPPRWRRERHIAVDAMGQYRYMRQSICPMAAGDFKWAYAVTFIGRLETVTPKSFCTQTFPGHGYGHHHKVWYNHIK